jgi:hypothetical protein
VFTLGTGWRTPLRPIRTDFTNASLNNSLNTAGMDANISVVSCSWRFNAPAPNAAAGRNRVRITRAALRVGLARVFAQGQIAVICSGNEAEDTERAFPAIFTVPNLAGTGIDDDLDGAVDEDPLDNVDNDLDGVVDEDPPENPQALAVGATGVNNLPIGPERYASSFSNTGTRVLMSAPGQGVRSVQANFPAGAAYTFSAAINGCSFATPHVSGAIAELENVAGALPAGLFSGGGITAAQRRLRVAQLVMATADDLGTTNAGAGDHLNDNAGNGPDTNFGFGRLNLWKATLSIANQGLAAQQGRDLIGGGPLMNMPNGFDDRFTQIPVINDATTQWYGFEIITSERQATIWLDGTQLADAGTNGPDAMPGGGDDLMPLAPNITAYKGVRSDQRLERGVHMASDGASMDAAPVAGGAPGQIVEEEPLTGIVPVGTQTNNRGEYVLTFSIQRADLYAGGQPKTLSIRKRGAAVADKPIFNLRLDTALMRTGAVSGVTFDDFVFQVVPPDYGDAAIKPTLLRGAGAMPENGARHHNTTLEWLGKLNPPGLPPMNPNPNLKGVTAEHNADMEALTGDAGVDVDGVTNRKNFQDRDGRDDGATFFPLTYRRDPANPNATPGKVEFTVRVHERASTRYGQNAATDPAGTALEDKSLFVNLWIDWNGNGMWEEANQEHVINGLQINPRALAADGQPWRIESQGAAAPGGTAVANTMRLLPLAGDQNAATFRSNIPVGIIGCGAIWARVRLDYGENVGRNDPLPMFRSLPSMRSLAAMPVPGLIGGAARYGEVEDYLIGSDFGDAPDDGMGHYPSLRAQMGARHLDIHQEWLGLDNAMRPGASREVDAKGDYNLGCLFLPLIIFGQGTDEDIIDNLRFSDTDLRDDGVMIPAFPRICGPNTTIPITVTISSSIAARGGAILPNPPNTTVSLPEDAADSLPRYDFTDPKRRLYLTGWADWNGDSMWAPAEKIIDQTIDPIDFGADGQYTLGEPFTDANNNGVFDAGEGFLDVFGKNTKAYTFNVPLPCNHVNNFFFRFRLNYGEAAGTTVDLANKEADEDARALNQEKGGALCGEVEDYRAVVNDWCENRIDISDGVTPFSSAGATTDGPVINNGCGGAGSTQIYSDIWYNYHYPGLAPAQVTVTVLGQDFLTKLAVYDGCNCPVNNANLLGCSGGIPNFKSEVTFTANPGGCYKIRVGGYWPFPLYNSGKGTIRIVPQMPANPCGAGSANNCAEPSPNGTPGCNDANCCNAVCAFDPFCCTILWDDDCAAAAAACNLPFISFSSQPYVYPESTSAVITVNLSTPAAQTVTVNYSTADGTATAGLDYLSTTGTLTWLPGQSGPKTFTVPLIDDSLPEPPEFAVLTLSGAVNATVVGTNPCTLTILDNDYPPILYVKFDATGANNGTSWADAFRELRDALTAAAASGGVTTQIWVAAGTYKPAPVGGDRSARFGLIEGVSIYGGFSGGETSLAQRNPAVNLTVLSGDLNGNDGPNFANNGENSYHVVTAAGGVGPAALLDGFIIAGGNANGASNDDRGGGLFADAASPTVRTCTFQSNAADYGGGGMFCLNSSNPLIADCAFTQNLAFGACGNCGGGGIYCEFNSNASIVNCRFDGNMAVVTGGGIFYREGSNGTVINCALSGNQAGFGGGICCAFSNSAITNCTLYSNSGSQYGGAVYIYQASPVVTNCVLWGDNSPNGPELALFACPSQPTISYCDVQGGQAAAFVNPGCTLGWGAGNLMQNPLLNAQGQLANGSPCIDAGNNGAVPPDFADLDADGNTAEPTPIDLAGGPRFVDDPATPDTGAGAPPIVDMGAFETAPAVPIAGSNPPTGTSNPYQPGQPFVDILQTGVGSSLTQGIGATGTPPQGPVQYAPIRVTFGSPPSPTPSASNVTVSCTGGMCPTVTAVTAVNSATFDISLSAPIPPLRCTTISFADGQKLQYRSHPGNVNLDTFSNTQDLLALVQALNNGTANLPVNLARYNVDRMGMVNTQDLLRIVQLLNGINTTQVFNGTTADACPP